MPLSDDRRWGWAFLSKTRRFFLETGGKGKGLPYPAPLDTCTKLHFSSDAKRRFAAGIRTQEAMPWPAFLWKVERSPRWRTRIRGGAACPSRWSACPQTPKSSGRSASSRRWRWFAPAAASDGSRPPGARASCAPHPPWSSCTKLAAASIRPGGPARQGKSLPCSCPPRD
ncbi:hypothetical protein D3C86_1428130 [compost metagenome]